MGKNDANRIREVYHAFLHSWEQGDKSGIKNCVVKLPYAYVSMFGHTYTKEQIAEWFCNPGPEGSVLRITPLQDTILTQEKIAQQYAVIIGVIKEGGRHLAFGGTFMIRYEKTKDSWRMETIRFQLQSDDGNREEYLDAEGIVHRIPGDGDRTLFGNWLLVDDRVGYFQDKIEHSGYMMITPELDAPWRVITSPDNEMSDKEKIMDTLCRTSCAFDFFSMMLAVPAFSQQAEADIHGMFGKMNWRDTLIYVKELRKSMPRCFTGILADTLEVRGNMAFAVLRICAPENYKEDEVVNFTKDVYDASFMKENGTWVINSLIRR